MAAFAPKRTEACDGVCIRVAATMKEKESVRKKEIKKLVRLSRCTKSGGNLVVRGLSGALGGFGARRCSLCRWSRRGKNVGSSTDSPEEKAKASFYNGHVEFLWPSEEMEKKKFRWDKRFDLNTVRLPG